jgi:hypothetical protein
MFDFVLIHSRVQAKQKLSKGHRLVNTAAQFSINDKSNGYWNYSLVRQNHSWFVFMAVYGAVSLNVAANVAEFQIIHIISILKAVHTLLTFTTTLNFTQIPETLPVTYFPASIYFP